MMAASNTKGDFARARAMTEKDLPQILEIEKDAFPDPWPEISFRQCLRFGYCCLVLECDDAVRAYGIMVIDPFNAHILNLCVHPEYRRRHLGRKILDHLLDEARDAGSQRVFLEVRPSNRAAIRLYRSAGFRLIGIRKGYYRTAHRDSEDALVFARKP